MKMSFLSIAAAATRKMTNITAILLTLVIFMAACSDDDNTFDADAAKAAGTYAVEDTAEWGEVENYSIEITRSPSGGPNLEISNFGDIMYVPVKATVAGNKLTIPAQTFKGKSMTIVLSGSGTLSGSTLNFDYTIEVDGDDDPLAHSCVAIKQDN